MTGMGNPDTWSVGHQDTVIAALDRAVAAHPERVLLDFGGELTTYGEFDQLSTRLAHSLAAWACAPATPSSPCSTIISTRWRAGSRRTSCARSAYR